MTQQMDLVMNTHDIADARAMNQPGIIEAFVALAKETVRTGHRVIIRNDADLAPVRTIGTMDDLLPWIDGIRRSDSQ